MGRECGDIALYAGVAGGAECVLLPEFDTDMDAVCKKVEDGVTTGKLHNIIIKAEGVPVDSNKLVKLLAEHTGRDVKLVVLSYLQRGGSPSYRDRILATQCGMKAIDLIKNGETGKAVGEVDGRIVAVDLEEALEAKAGVDLEMYKAVDILSM